MPIIEAWPLGGTFEGHYAGAFPEGERTYPSQRALINAAERIGSAVRFLPRPTSLTAVEGIPPTTRRRTEAADASPAGGPPPRSTQPVAAGAVDPPG